MKIDTLHHVDPPRLDEIWDPSHTKDEAEILKVRRKGQPLGIANEDSQDYPGVVLRTEVCNDV